jgi:hypothetical protein
MSKLETPMTRWYWRQIGGTLIEEFCAVRGSHTCGVRLLDGLIVKGGDFRIAKQAEVSIQGKDIVIVQTKARRLGMYLLGQAFFSAQLMHRFHPRSVESVALVTQDDDVLRPLFEQYQGMRVVVCPREVFVQPSKDNGSDVVPEGGIGSGSGHG